jgi:DNA-binding response OmpR family regulator
VVNYKKALIIDDDADLCLMLKSVVKMLIPDVLTAQTLAQGKQLVNSFNPDVVFLDNNLPDGHGLNTIKEIREALPSAFIIFITAMDSHNEEAIELGADVFLAKPFTYNSVQQALGFTATKS